MEAIKDLGQIKISSENEVIWRIPNFYDLPQNYDTVIRSPCVRYENTDWYMEVYPNGRRLYCSLGWFEIRVLNHNCDFRARDVCRFSIVDLKESRLISTEEQSYGDRSYYCTRLLPASLLKSWKDVFVPKGDMYLTFGIQVFFYCSGDRIYLNLRASDVQKLFQKNFENACVEASLQSEEKKELPMETTVGEVEEIGWESIKWVIPNFSDHFHRYDTVIRSSRFHFKDSDWYMEIYPNGRSLYSSLGWFGIGIYNLNSASTLRCTTVRVMEGTYEMDVGLKADSHNKGFYRCFKLLPTSIFKSWQDVIATCGNLKLFFLFDKKDKDDEDENDTENIIMMGIGNKTMQRWYERTLVNGDSFIEASTQTDEEIGNFA